MAYLKMNTRLFQALNSMHKAGILLLCERFAVSTVISNGKMGKNTFAEQTGQLTCLFYFFYSYFIFISTIIFS